MVDMLCGIALLAIGYLAGAHKARRKKLPELEITEHERERAEQYRAGWDLMLNYEGRKADGNR